MKDFADRYIPEIFHWVFWVPAIISLLIFYSFVSVLSVLVPPNTGRRMRERCWSRGGFS